ncbi:magnesium/cobalt transporter CorA [Sporichthya brevicatena]|uniref:Magnesium/cobalt transporter CorA n=1 Tax=Sporichthya brevicatena TaxID=171442 RepID=A0ABN1GMU5_9ACTN
MTELAQRPGRSRPVRCARYVGGRRVDLTLEGAFAACSAEGFVWIECTDPSREDIAAVAAEFRLPELAVADAVAAHQRPKLEAHGDILLVVLKPVHYVDSYEVVEVTEVALFLGPSFVVTIRHGDNDVLDRVRRDLDSGEHPEFGVAGVLYRVADRVVDGYQEAIDYIYDDVDEIEEQVFGGGDEDRSERIYSLKREVADFRRAVSPLSRTLETLADGRHPVLTPEVEPYFRGVHDHLLRAADNVEAIDRLLSDVLQANVAQVSVRQAQIQLRQNEDMRRISAWAAIALVPTAVAGIYGMNFEHMPELNWQYGYPLVLGVILTICLALYLNFRARHWLGAPAVADPQAEGAGRVRRELKSRARKLRRTARLGSGS